jgi:hypothetical protein
MELGQGRRANDAGADCVHQRGAKPVPHDLQGCLPVACAAWPACLTRRKSCLSQCPCLRMLQHRWLQPAAGEDDEDWRRFMFLAPFSCRASWRSVQSVGGGVDSLTDIDLQWWIGWLAIGLMEFL